MRQTALFLSVLLLAVPSWAQTFRAQVSGTVADNSGAVIPGVEVVVTNLDTQVAARTVSNDQGIYRVLNLQPGRYRVEASLAGFKKFVQEPIVLQVNDHKAVNVRLEIGALTETVTVTGAAPLLESQDATFGQVVTERSIQELPLNIKDPMALLILTPGVTTGGSFGNAGGTDVGRNYFKSDFRVGGGRSHSQDVLLDGSPSTIGDRNFISYIPPVDSTQEFKVQANSYSAEFGRTTGGVVSMVTKSGTNEYHGVAYEYHRNSVLDANNFFNNKANIRKTSFRRHQFGGNVGGPILKEKTFFFVDYEGLRQAFPATRTSTVPTTLQRRGDFSQTFTSTGRLIVIHDPLTLRTEGGKQVRSAFPGNVIPSSRFDAIASRALTYYPEPNTPGDPVTGANNFVYAATDLMDSNKGGFRIDHNIGQSNRLNGRFSYQRTERIIPANWDNDASPLARNQLDQFYNVVIGDTHTFTPSLTGELRASFSRGHPQQQGRSNGFDITTLGFPKSMTDAVFPSFPFFNITDMTGTGNGIINNQPRNTYALMGNVGKIAGRHAFRMGFDYRVMDFHEFQNTNPTGSFTFSRLFTQGPDPLQSRVDAGHGLASFLLGAGSSGGVDHISGLSLRRLYYAFYFQDDWKVTPRFTLNLGMRYDLTQGNFERYDLLAWIDLEAASPLKSEGNLPLRGIVQYVGQEGNPRSQIDTDTNNFGPRFGFAYQWSERTVVRGGYGIFYVPVYVRNWGSIGFNTNTPWVATIDSLRTENSLSNPFPQGFNLPRDQRDPLTNVGFGIEGWLRDEPVGYTQQWSLTVQREIVPSLVVEAAYWGNKGTKLQYGSGFQENYLGEQHLALGTALNERLVNPFFGVIPTGALSGATVTRRQLLLPFPQYTSVFRNSPFAGSSTYHAFTLRVEKRVTRGLSFLASYTSSKTIADSPANEGNGGAGGILNMDNRRGERSVVGFDVPQRLVLSHVYDLPFGRGQAWGADLHPVLNTFLGGWKFSGIVTFQSGFPIHIGRPAVNNGKTAELDKPSIDRWFDTSVFTPAATFTFGNVGPFQPDARDDGINNFDFTLTKDFMILERFRLQFRSEFFNAFNTPQFANPNDSVTSTSFGRVTAVENSAREIQFALKLYF